MRLGSVLLLHLFSLLLITTAYRVNTMSLSTALASISSSEERDIMISKLMQILDKSLKDSNTDLDTYTRVNAILNKYRLADKMDNSLAPNKRMKSKIIGSGDPIYGRQQHWDVRFGKK